MLIMELNAPLCFQCAILDLSASSPSVFIIVVVAAIAWISIFIGFLYMLISKKLISLSISLQITNTMSIKIANTIYHSLTTICLTNLLVLIFEWIYILLLNFVINILHIENNLNTNSKHVILNKNYLVKISQNLKLYFLGKGSNKPFTRKVN